MLAVGEIEEKERVYGNATLFTQFCCEAKLL
jgi:hypothetical protein